jgi:hypothetical protein
VEQSMTSWTQASAALFQPVDVYQKLSLLLMDNRSFDYERITMAGIGLC